MVVVDSVANSEIVESLEFVVVVCTSAGAIVAKAAGVIEFIGGADVDGGANVDGGAKMCGVDTTCANDGFTRGVACVVD
jgi:hypothetical protein